MNTAVLLQELQFRAVRSSGAGEQHVNKVATKIEVYFDVPKSQAPSETEKERLTAKLANRLTKAGIIFLQCDDTRSQHRNKERVIKRLLDLLKENLSMPKKRKATRPTRAAVEKRLQAKKRTSQKKSDRSKPNLD